MKAYDVKRGNVIEHDGKVYQVREVEKSAPQGRGGNTKYRVIMYSVPGGIKLDVTFGGEDDMREVDLSRRPVSYSYMDGEAFVFMDIEDYTQYLLGPEVVGENAGYITEGLEGAQVQLIDDQAVGLQMPQSVILEVIETAPELKGSSATKRNKPATLNTGIEVQVPEYIVSGEKIWVSTVTGEFGGRA
jgi:elongation factor P